MRQCAKNTRLLHYAHRQYGEHLMREDGTQSAEIATSYGIPSPIRMAVSVPTGEWEVAMFGGETRYSLVASRTRKCAMAEGDVVWVNSSFEDGPDYVAVAVKQWLNECVVALSEIKSNADYD